MKSKSTLKLSVLALAIAASTASNANQIVIDSADPTIDSVYTNGNFDGVTYTSEITGSYKYDSSYIGDIYNYINESVSLTNVDPRAHANLSDITDPSKLVTPTDIDGDGVNDEEYQELIGHKAATSLAADFTLDSSKETIDYNTGKGSYINSFTKGSGTISEIGVDKYANYILPDLTNPDYADNYERSLVLDVLTSETLGEIYLSQDGVDTSHGLFKETVASGVTTRTTTAHNSETFTVDKTVDGTLTQNTIVGAGYVDVGSKAENGFAPGTPVTTNHLAQKYEDASGQFYIVRHGETGDILNAFTMDPATGTPLHFALADAQTRLSGSTFVWGGTASNYRTDNYDETTRVRLFDDSNVTYKDEVRSSVASEFDFAVTPAVPTPALPGEEYLGVFAPTDANYTVQKDSVDLGSLTDAGSKLYGVVAESDYAVYDRNDKLLSGSQHKSVLDSQKLVLDSNVDGVTAQTTINASGVTTGSIKADSISVNGLDVETSLNNLDADLTAVQGDVATLKTDMTAVQGDVATLKTDMTAVQGDVATLQTDMTAVQGRVTAVEGDIATLKTDMTAVQGDVSTLKTDVKAVEGRVTAVEGDVATLQTDVSDLGNTVTQEVNRLDQAITSSSTNTLAAAKTAAEAGDAATLASAKAHTDAGLTAAATDRAAIRTELAAGDAATLTAAKSHSDTVAAQNLATARTEIAAGDAKTLADAKAYTNDVVNDVVNTAVANVNKGLNNLSKRLDDVEETAYRGTAIALAAAQAIPNIKAGQFALFGGVGHYEGESAVALGGVYAVSDAVTITGALGTAGNEVGGRVGASFIFGAK